MTKPSSQFLNNQCLVTSNRRVNNQLLSTVSEDARQHIIKDVERQVARNLGETIIETHVPVTSEPDGPFHTCYSAEAYVVTPSDMRILYDLLRKEIRFEIEGEQTEQVG